MLVEQEHMVIKHKMLFLLAIGLILLSTGLVGNQTVHSQTVASATPASSTSLSDQLGFQAPVLNDFQQHGIVEIAENIAFTAYGHNYRLVRVWPTLENRQKLGLGSVLMFQVDSAQGNLIWRVDAGNLDFLDLSGGQSTPRNWPAPGDWEQNGKLDFGMYDYFSNTCPSNFAHLDIYVLNPDNTITSRLSKIIPAGYAVNSVEQGKNGSLLLTALDIRGFSSRMAVSSCTGPVIDRYFELTDSKLTEVSAQHSDAYTNQIGYLVYYLTTWQPQTVSDPENNSKLYASQLMELLLIYDALNQRDAGYALIKSITAQAFDTGRTEHNTYIDTTFLPTMAHLYEKNEPFIPPDFVGPNPQDLLDFYP